MARSASGAESEEELLSGPYGAAVRGPASNGGKEMVMVKTLRPAALHGLLIVLAAWLGGGCGSGVFTAPESGLETPMSEPVQADRRADQSGRPTTAGPTRVDRRSDEAQGSTSITDLPAAPDQEAPTGGWSDPTTTVAVAGDADVDSDAPAEELPPGATRPANNGDDMTADEAMPDPEPAFTIPVGHDELDGRPGRPPTNRVPLTVPEPGLARRDGHR